MHPIRTFPARTVIFAALLNPFVFGLCAEEKGDSGAGVHTFPASIFEPKRVLLDRKDTKVSAILREIEERTGNRILVSETVNDVLLSQFKSEGETFWPLVDRLAAFSKNAYWLFKPVGGPYEVRFRAGSKMGYPVAYNGPFKMAVKSVEITADLRTGNQEVGFGLVMLSEPRLLGKKYSKFLIRDVQFLSAKDDTGRVYSQEACPNNVLVWSWERLGQAVTHWDGDLDSIRIRGVSPTAKRIVRLSVEVPVFQILEIRELRFREPFSSTGPVSMKTGGFTLTISETKVAGDDVNALLTIQGKEVPRRNRFGLCIERKGKYIRYISAHFAGSDKNQRVFLLSVPKRFLEKPYDLFIRFVSSVARKSFRFDFENVVLR